MGELVSDAAEGLEVDWMAYHKVANVPDTSVSLRAGSGGSLQRYEDVSGFETVLENISFGGSGILAANAHCDTTCQADTCPEPSRRAARPEVQAVQLIEEGAPATDGYSNNLSMGHPSTSTYGGVPYEAWTCYLHMDGGVRHKIRHEMIPHGTIRATGYNSGRVLYGASAVLEQTILGHPIKML